MHLFVLMPDDSLSSDMPDQSVYNYTPGMLGAMLLCAFLASFFSFEGWIPGIVLSGLHVASLWVFIGQVGFISLLVWFCSLLFSVFPRRKSAQAIEAQAATLRALRWLLRTTSILFVVVTISILIIEALPGRALPLPLCSFCLLMPLFSFCPYLFNLAWVYSRFSGKQRLIGTTLGNLSPEDASAIPAKSTSTYTLPPDLDR